MPDKNNAHSYFTVKDNNRDFISVSVPLSKSISNRVQIINFLQAYISPAEIVSEAQDSIDLCRCLKMIGGLNGKGGYVNAGEGGTTLRFLLATLCICQGEWLLDCEGSLKSRPILPLVRVLREAGAVIEFPAEGIFPLKIRGNQLLPSEISIPSSISSQFASALMLVAPCFGSDTRIILDEKPVSLPYIHMTKSLMRKAGALIHNDENTYAISANGYNGIKIMYAEGDWSSAAFWYSLAALKDVKVSIDNMQFPSLQGDSYCLQLYHALGVNTVIRGNQIILQKDRIEDKEICFDFSDYPDLAMPFIICCAILKRHAKFTGLDSLELKESRRLTELCIALNEAGVVYLRKANSDLVLYPSEIKKSFSLNSARDHRLAMTYSLFAIAGYDLKLENPYCTGKSYPQFWKEMEKAGLYINDSY